MAVFLDWENVDSTLYATRGQIWDRELYLPKNIDFVHTVSTNRSIQEYKLYEVKMAKPFLKMNKVMFNNLLGYKQLLNALYVINNLAKAKSEYIKHNKMDKSQEVKISKLEEEKNELYRIKGEALKYLYGENRINLEGYHTIGTDKRKAYSFERHPYSFHNWAETFNVFTPNYLGHLPQFPKGKQKQEFYNEDEARRLLNRYINDYVNDETI